ncbi:MAG: hypothetical protein ACYSUD_14245 [Planctomycetota bacterium]|jgi:hypothetical protein
MITELEQTRKALNPLMLELGWVVYICQMFEGSLLFLHRLIDQDEGLLDEDMQKSERFYSKATLRPMLNVLRGRIEVSAELDSYLGEGIDYRNELIHRFMTDRFNNKKGSRNLFAQRVRRWLCH